MAFWLPLIAGTAIGSGAIWPLLGASSGGGSFMDDFNLYMIISSLSSFLILILVIVFLVI